MLQYRVIRGHPAGTAARLARNQGPPAPQGQNARHRIRDQRRNGIRITPKLCFTIIPLTGKNDISLHKAPTIT